MAKYQPHSGYYYADIGDGFDFTKIDFCHIVPQGHETGVMILKCDNEVAIYDFKELLDRREQAKVLNYKRFNNPEDAYSKMLKWIGKLIKKSVFASDGYHVSRYYNNKQDQSYNSPKFIRNQEMQQIYSYMENFA